MQTRCKYLQTTMYNKPLWPHARFAVHVHLAQFPCHSRLALCWDRGDIVHARLPAPLPLGALLGPRGHCPRSTSCAAPAVKLCWDRGDIVLARLAALLQLRCLWLLTMSISVSDSRMARTSSTLPSAAGPGPAPGPATALAHAPAPPSCGGTPAGGLRLYLDRQ